MLNCVLGEEATQQGMRATMKCSLDAAEGEEVGLEAGRLIRHWREFRTDPDCEGAKDAERRVIEHIRRHLGGVSVVDYTGLVVMINPLDPTSLWAHHPLEV